MLGLFILGMKLSGPHEAAEKRTFSKLFHGKHLQRTEAGEP